MPQARQPTARQALAVVEAAYSLTEDDNQWLARILELATPDLDRGRGTNAFTCEVAAATLSMGPAYAERSLDPLWSQQVAEFNRTVPAASFEVLGRSGVLCGGFLELAGNVPAIMAHFDAIPGNVGIADAFTLFVQDGEGYGINLAAPAHGRVRLHPRVSGIWRRVGVHLASAMRLRRHLSALKSEPEALLAPSGDVAHAEGRVRKNPTARQLLSRAVRGVERARTAKERRDPEHALELWRGLVAGEWSLVDHWEQDGRRYLAAYRNRPHVQDPRALTQQERLVLRFAALGASNKDIAFTLGLSTTSVGMAISQITRKLRCRRSDLSAWIDPAKAQHAALAMRPGELGILSVPHAVGGPKAELLSVAQRAVVDQVLRGKSNAQIAKARGTSPRTVANQLRQVFERLGVGSRAELVSTLTRSNVG